MLDPLVSVILPVWNGARYLAPAIESVLNQTLRSLELIIIDDGSIDATAAIADEYASRDARVRVLKRSHDGLSPSLNAGIAAARGFYIARMDADDVNLLHRLETQVEYLYLHPDCVAIGSWIEVIDEEGKHIGINTVARTHPEIVATLLRGVSAIAHPTMMARRSALDAAGGYDARLYPSEDFDLWFRLAEVGQLANVPEPLLQYRRHADAIGIRDLEEQFAMGTTITNDARKKRGLPPRRWRHLIAAPHGRSRYHFECARTALSGGPRLTALRHAAATVALEPTWPYAYATLLACALPRRVLRYLLALRASAPAESSTGG